MLRGRAESLPLSISDRAFAQRIYRETVIWKKYLDHVIGGYIRLPVHKLDQDVLASLRIGAVQMLVMGTPPHAAVSATVEAHPGQKSRGLVNAVLRKIAVHSDSPDLPLHIRYSHPEELVRRWTALFGENRTEELLKWNNSSPGLGGYAFSSIPAGTSPGRYLERYRILERHGRFEPPEGLYIQDESAALVGAGMRALPGDTVLEIGAAPGGKTAHLAGRGMILSIDSKPDRMKRWQDNGSRLNWRDCFGVCARSDQLPFSRRFSKVIADVPCTNTGVYRRRIDARWNWSPDLLSELVSLQRRILADSANSTEQGGILIYSTCSIDPSENTETVIHFEQTHRGFERIGFPGPDALVDSDGFLSYFPPEAGIDGLFAAAWKKSR